MNDSKSDVADDRLEEAIRHLCEQEVSAIVPDYVIVSTLDAIQGSADGSALRRTRKGFVWPAMRYSVIAATLAGLFVAGLWHAFPLVDAPTAFAQVVENAASAQSVRFRAQLQLGERDAMVSRVSIRGDQFRMEVPLAGGQAVDFRTRKAAAWNVPEKRGWTWEVPADEIDKLRAQVTDPIAAFRKLGGLDSVKVRTDSFAGKTVDVFQVDDFSLFGVSGVGGGENDTARVLAEIWVDRVSRMPVQIITKNARLSQNDESSEAVRLVLDEFHWNAELPGDASQVEVPAGYTVTKGEPPSSR